MRIWTYKNADEKAHTLSRRSKNVKKRTKTYEKRILCKFTFMFADCCTLIAVATFQGLGTSLLTVPENLLQPYGYGLVLAWCCWVLHLPAVPLVVFEAWYRNREPDNDEPSHSSSSRPSSHSRVRPTAEM